MCTDGFMVVYYQEQVAQRVKAAVFDIGKARGHLLTRRPFQSLWFSSQISLSIELWNYDRTMMQALELGKTFLIPLETLDALWPCEGECIHGGPGENSATMCSR